MNDRIVILEFPHAFPPDGAELRVSDVSSARALLGKAALPLDALFTRRRKQWAALLEADADLAMLARTEDAVRLAYARLALRHGHLGKDFHAYHNEGHILDICAGRIDRVVDACGLETMRLEDWCALMLFGAGHDLRQREAPQLVAGVGANERASIAETHRILAICGFSPERDADFYLATELMIAGSTFDARPPPGGYQYNAADLVQSGGALAATLDRTLDERVPGWRADCTRLNAYRLALIAADLDTANVAEPFEKFAQSAENLCREREMLSGRSLDAAESALPTLEFLTDGQDYFFFELHRFHSDPGRLAFAGGKAANAGQLKALCMGVRARIALAGTPVDGNQVMAVYRRARGDLAAVDIDPSKRG